MEKYKNEHGTNLTVRSIYLLNHLISSTMFILRTSHYITLK